jgi:hypothetical protein
MSLVRDDRLRVVVLGYVVRGPLGGLAWHYLQYVLGLARLGHDVWFVEDSDDYPGCYHPATGEVDSDPGDGLAFAEAAFARLGLADRWAYHDAHTGRWLGPAAARMPRLAAQADVVLNVSGANPLREPLLTVPHRVLVDTDPGFTQVHHRTDPGRRARAEAHTAFATFGERIAAGDATVPDDGLPWTATRQPIVTDVWPTTPAPRGAPLTTVMQWDSYDGVEHDGIAYGMKSRSFEEIAALPARSPVPLEVAIGAPTPVCDRLASLGWRVASSQAVTPDPWTYRSYLASSGGEISVAKHGYVVGRTGWFSERSANYLASGRPVVVQDTGLEGVLPRGEGLLTFCDLDGALAGIEAVHAAPDRHRRAARELVDEHFAAPRVLTDLLETAMANREVRA